jgi:hypothetical protein
MALWFHTDQPGQRHRRNLDPTVQNASSVPQRSMTNTELWIGVAILSCAILIGLALPWV